MSGSSVPRRRIAIAADGPRTPSLWRRRSHPSRSSSKHTPCTWRSPVGAGRTAANAGSAKGTPGRLKASSHPTRHAGAMAAGSNPRRSRVPRSMLAPNAKFQAVAGGTTAAAQVPAADRVA
uniref:Uncharacterized protein n=1 Tax=Alexandrium monilatum TaxID=311494 RepID=A0A6T0X305_9DINO